MSRLVCLGILVKDIVFRVPHIPATPQKLTCSAMRTQFGGMAATAAAAAAALGGTVEFWGRVGDDPTGEEAAQALRQAGVQARLRVSAGSRSPVSAVIVDDAGRDLTNALFGEIMTATAVAIGVAGIVLNGAVRDAHEIGQGEFPLYAAGVTHRGPYKDGPGEINVPIAIDGMVIEPGDLMLGDADGLLCVPYDSLQTVLEATLQKMDAEKKMLADIAAGKLDTAWIDATLRRIGCNPEPQ